MMIVTIPLLSHRDNNRTVIYKTMPKMIITKMRYQEDRPHWWYAKKAWQNLLAERG